MKRPNLKNVLPPGRFFSLYLIVMIILISSCSWNNPYMETQLTPTAVPTSDPTPNPTPLLGLILIQADSTGFITVELTFDQNIDPTDAVNTDNYSIGGLSILGADLPEQDTVRLITSEQNDQTYTVTVANIQNQANTTTIAPPNNTAVFTGVGYTPSVTFPIVDITIGDPGINSIQDAIDAAATGDVISIPAGMYDENLVVDKQVILIGAGNESDPASNTIIESSSVVPAEHTIMITTGGTSETDRLVFMDMRIQGDVGTGNDGTPINIATADGHILFENLAVINNGGRGICFDPAGSTQDVIVNYCNISNNGNQGFRIPSTVPHIEGLVFSNCSFFDNGGSGIYSENELDPLSDITIQNCAFSGNAAGVYQTGDILLSNYRGDLTITDVVIYSSGCESGMRITGRSAGGGVGYAAGVITLTNITILGTQVSLGSYPSSAITFTRYSDVSNVSFNNILLKSSAPNGLFLGTITSTPMNTGTITFDGTYANGDIYLGSHGNSGSYSVTNVAIDATNCLFTGAENDADIEARVYHFPDDNSLGVVTWTTP